MGGNESGYSESNPRKITTASALQIDLQPFLRAGIIGEPGEIRSGWRELSFGEFTGKLTLEHRGDGRDRITVTLSDDIGKALLTQSIGLTTTPCHYGGYRHWFVCDGCQRRKAVLWAIFGEVRCRTCQKLAYPSTLVEPSDGFLDKCERLNRRLGWNGCGPISEPAPRPKGMHRKTYLRICDEIRDAYTDAIRSVLGIP